LVRTLYSAETRVPYDSGHKLPTDRRTVSPITVLFRPWNAKLKLRAASDIEKMMTSVRENPHLEPDGHHIGHVEMILGLLYKSQREMSLQILMRNEKLSFSKLLKNLPVILRVTLTAPSRIEAFDFVDATF
jgi:hypothetical protein